MPKRGQTTAPPADPDEIVKKIVAARAGGYLLLGDDGLDQEEVAARVVAELTNEQIRPFNYDVFRADDREVTPEAISGAVVAYPVLADARVVLVQGLEAAREDVGAELAKLAERGLTSTVLLLLAEKLDGRKKWAISLRQHCTVFNMSLPKGRALSGWVRRRAKMLGMAMADAAAELLVEYVGADVYRAASEVEKLALYVEPRKTIGLNDVEEAVGITREDTVYQLTDCIAKPDVAGALRIAHRMMETGKKPAFLVAMIVQHWQMLRMTESFRRDGHEGRMKELLGKNQAFLFPKYMAQARALRFDRVRTGFRLALAAESAIKGGWSPPEVVLEALICQLAGSGAALTKSRIS